MKRVVIAMNNPLVEEFAERWATLGGLCYFAEAGTDPGAAFRQAVGDLLGEANGPGSALYWSGPDWDGKAWAEWTRPLDSVQFVAWDGTPVMREVAAGADLGITGCSWAVAATGSVALYHTPLTGLLPSVLPPAHLVLVNHKDIVATVADGLGRVRGNLPPLMKIITGPSMTADIEGTLVVGVHGPGRVAALIY